MPDLISFARGAPSPDIVDVAGLSAAAVRAFATDPAGIIGYGTGAGYLPLREWIAEQHGVAVDQVMVTNGSLQADVLLFDELVGPGDEVVVEGPTYDRTLSGLVGSGARVHQVTVETDGIDVDALARLLAGGARPRLVHVIPNFQNPSGATLSLAKRRALLELAAAHGFVIFEDDPYARIRFRGEPLPSLLSLDDGAGRVVHASSFTKTVCPGVRVGYLIGPVDLIRRLSARATRTYISPGMVAQGIVHQFCVSGDIDRSVARVCEALSKRVRLLADALRTHLPESRFTEPDGGYFLWLQLPPGAGAAEVTEAAAERGVAVVRGDDFLLSGGEGALRLAYSAVTEDRIEEGVRRLADAVAAVTRAA